MPEADGTSPKRTIDERLDALTMNFELREAQWQHESDRISRLGDKVDKLADKVDKLADSVEDMRSVVMPALQNLIVAVTAHENRISRLEKRAS